MLRLRVSEINVFLKYNDRGGAETQRKSQTTSMKSFPLIVTLILTSALAMAQAKSSAGMPKLISTWGRTASGNLKPDQVIRLTDSSMNVRDDKGAALAVTGFRINYTFMSTYKDQESGELKTSKELRVYDFNDTTALSALWKASISENVKAGDEILFNKITARHRPARNTSRRTSGSK